MQRLWLVLWLLAALGGFASSSVRAADGLASDFPVQEAQLIELVSGSQCVGVSVDLRGQVLWVGPTWRQLILRTSAGVLRVQMNLSGDPILQAGDNVRLSGIGLAGLGLLNEALADNDGLHAATEKSGTIVLGRGLHPFRADWFNGHADELFRLEYAGPNLRRQRIPDSAFFRSAPDLNDPGTWQPGLNYRCFVGAWEWLPTWRDWLPIQSGVVSNIDLSVRVQKDDVGLAFSGFLKIDEPGEYTFWSESDDGSRLFVGGPALTIEKIDSSPLPVPRKISPGQRLAEGDDFIWSSIEGLVTGVHADLAGTMRVELSGELGRLFVEFKTAGARAPELFSRIRAVGVCRGVQTTGGDWIAARLMVPDPVYIEQLADGNPSGPSTTTLSDLRRLAATGQRTGASLCLTGIVLSAPTPGGWFAFQDDTGAVPVRMLGAGSRLAAGERIVLKGSGALDHNRLLMTPAPLIDNDGVHARRERDGAMYLRQGYVPLHVSWFNRKSYYTLDLYYQGPGVTRQRVPADVLFHPEVSADGTVSWAPGVNCVTYRGDWLTMPQTSQLDPVEIGQLSEFNLRIDGDAETIGMELSCFLKVPQDGDYFFTLASDDGALLFLGEQFPEVERLGSASPPPPLAIVPRQVLEPDQNYRWSEIEGVVNFACIKDGALVLELGSDYGPVNVEVVDGADSSPLLLLGSYLRVRGICESGRITSGPGIAANLIVPGMGQVEVIRPLSSLWDRYQTEKIASLPGRIVALHDEMVVRLVGTADIAESARMFTLTDDSGRIEVGVARPASTNYSGRVEVLGRLIRSETNVVLRSALFRRVSDESEVGAGELPLLTKILQVKQLSRERAQQGLPVKIRGVITLVRGSGTGFIIQDDTSAIDVWWPPHSNTSLPRVGDYWEVEGTTFLEFAPNIRVQHAARLGPGVMPEPLHPAWDQLLNGSLDTRYVEVQGVVTDAITNGVTLLTPSGKIQVLISPVPDGSLARYRNALVRIRGCVVPVRSQTSQQIQVGQTRLSNASISVDEPAPSDPFAALMKHPSELLLFDARAGSLQRVKIAGQVLHARDEELFLLDDSSPIRVWLQEPADVKPGDRVEAVGFPQLGGPSPVLREAVLRKTSSAPMPVPLEVDGDDLSRYARDGVLISLQARLLGVSGVRSEKVLEVQNGNRDFVAWVTDPDGALAKLVVGSRLQLTGVYAEERGRTLGQEQASFALLLNSPADVKVLATPPWWTLERVLMVAGLLLLLIVAGMFWIILLHRRVDEAAARLAVEVRHREKIQQQNALERERSRIAKDMHDELGANVTQVGLLAELTKNNLDDPDKARLHADRICQRALELGRTLNEVVWAVNPKNDSLDKFCDYLAVHAQELFQLTDVLCRVDLPPEMPSFPLSSDVRHNLFLSVKEALNNIIRHANAREVWVRLQLEEAVFKIAIVDDGQGFAANPKPSMRNGLHNMRRRLEDIGGHCAINSQPGKGTEVKFTFPLPQPANDSVKAVARSL